MAFKLHIKWQTTLLNRKRKTGPPLGLTNQGNTCYLNSVLQCLTYTPHLSNFCINHLHTFNCDIALGGNKKHDCPFCILEKRIARSLSTGVSLNSPAKINNCLRIFADHFQSGRQEDAHEFLRCVIDACHNTCLRIKKLSPKRGDFLNDKIVVKEVFGGVLHQVKCLACGNESNKVDEIMDISLDVVCSSSVKGALHEFFLPEALDGDNKYKCENCKSFVSVRKQMSILQAPNVLVIQLRRFEGIFFFMLSSFICKANMDQNRHYKLFGTIVHSGDSSKSAHYYVYVKDAIGRWYCCNDYFVTFSSLQEVLSKKVYILFFSCMNQKASPTSTYFSSKGIVSSASSWTNKPRTVNGNKSCISHGNGVTKLPKTVHSGKKLCSTFIAEDSLVETSSTLPKIDRIQKKGQDSKTSISSLPSQISLVCGCSEVSSELTDARIYNSQGLHNGVRSYPSKSRLKIKSSNESSNCTLLSEDLVNMKGIKVFHLSWLDNVHIYFTYLIRLIKQHSLY
uniref:ubiquitinyl hydrolase 1 n=1 Tax=Kalanchoe fedtschenkoi TaxID=63787 RepID=A0A7N1A373_KALFE